MSDRSKLEDWERELMDEEWEEAGPVIPARLRKTSIHSVRFERDELRRLRKAAATAGVSTSTFIRQAVARELANREAPASDLSEELQRAADMVQAVSAALRTRAPSANDDSP